MSVFNELRNTLETGIFDFKMSAPARPEKDAASALKRIEIKERRAKEAYMAGIDTLEEYRELRNALRAEREALEAKASTISREEARRILLGRIREVLQVLQSDDFTDEQKGSAIRNVVEKIVYDRPRRELIFVYRYS